MPSWLVRLVKLSAIVLTFAVALEQSAEAGACGHIGEECCPTPLTPCTEGGCDGTNCVDCGDGGQPCCLGTQCDAGFECFAFSESIEPGQGGGAGVTPFSVCLPCGGADQPCCDGTMCSEGFNCLPDPCDTTEGQGSGAGLFPCQLNQESGGGAGVFFTCQPCGGDSQLCCNGVTCASGFVCLDECGARFEGQGGGGWDCTEADGQGGGAGEAPPTCVPCGDLGDPCCEDSTCNGQNLLCGGSFCEACGDLGKQCCANDTCPGAAALCTDDMCAPPPAPVMGSTGIAMLVLLLSGVAFLGLRRVGAS